MRPTPGEHPPHAESGFALIEVVVSGMVAVIAAAGIMALMSSSVRSAGDQRDRSQSYAIAQEDQARLRATRIPVLRTIPASGEIRTVTVGNTTYTVKSTAKFVNDVSETVSCGAGTSTEDYLKISSEVTWPNMSPTPTTAIRGIISPPSNSLNPKTGTLVFNARNSRNVALNGLSVSGTGAGTFGGTTNSLGCAAFLEQASGAYTLRISGGATGIVDVDGALLPADKPLTVNPQVTTSVDLLYDTPGSVKVKFVTSTYTTGTEAATAANLIAFNSGMTTAKKYTFTPATSFTATSLFPFTSADSFYVGTCTDNAPSTGTGMASVAIPQGAAAAEQTITMPALLLNVKVNNVATNSVPVKITPADCGAPAIATTTSKQPTSGGTDGRLAAQELPWGTYTVCAWTTISSTKKRVQETFDVKELKTEKTFNITSSSETGEC